MTRALLPLVVAACLGMMVLGAGMSVEMPVTELGGPVAVLDTPAPFTAADFVLLDEAGQAMPLEDSEFGQMLSLYEGAQTARGVRIGDSAVDALAKYAWPVGLAVWGPEDANWPEGIYVLENSESLKNLNGYFEATAIVVMLGADYAPLDAFATVEDDVAMEMAGMFGMLLEDGRVADVMFKMPTAQTATPLPQEEGGAEAFTAADFVFVDVKGNAAPAEAGPRADGYIWLSDHGYARTARGVRIGDAALEALAKYPWPVGYAVWGDEEAVWPEGIHILQDVEQDFQAIATYGRHISIAVRLDGGYAPVNAFAAAEDGALDAQVGVFGLVIEDGIVQDVVCRPPVEEAEAP